MVHQRTAQDPIKGAIPHKQFHAGIKFSKTEVLELKQVFDDHDLNHDGQVTPTELYKSLRNNKHFTAQGREAFRALDTHHVGRLDFETYLRACFPSATQRELDIMLGWASPRKGLTPYAAYTMTAEQVSDIIRMFNMYDKNKNGKIERQELRIMALTCGYDEGETEILFETMDQDKDDFISIEEFTDLMARSFIGCE